MKMATIRFTQEFTLANALRPRRYRAGQTLDCNEATAMRYIRRGVAERAGDPPAPASADDGDQDAGLFEGDENGGAEPKPKAKGGKKRQRIE
jgi:hypothetical protein